MKDQQEAERKKVTSQEIQVALIKQTEIINEKQASVMEDLAKVEPAVIEAQNGKSTNWLWMVDDSSIGMKWSEWLDIEIGQYIVCCWNGVDPGW